MIKKEHIKMTINPKIFELAIQAGACNDCGAPIFNEVIVFAPSEFEDFMTRYTRYVQARMEGIVKTANDQGTYMGDDVPSWLLIYELEKSLTGEE